jgi:glycosyltransferase involved in cell wall biosynthesis
MTEDEIADLPRRLIPRVLIVYGKYAGPNLWRCWWPAGYLSLHGFVVDTCLVDKFDDQRGLLENGRYNIVVTPRFAFQTERSFRLWNDVIRGLGLRWIYDADDDLWSPEFPERQLRVFEGMPDAKTTLKEYDYERLQRMYVLRRVDAVTVTTPELAETAAKFTRAPVHVIPNLINVAAFESDARKQRRDIPPLTVGWSGTRRQDDDLETVAAAWSIVAKQHPDVAFIVQGYQSPVLCRAVPSNQLVVLRSVEVNAYPAVLSNIDVACCAVSADPWNTNKSPIKFYEATLAGSACVVSRDLYGPHVRHGLTGYVAETVEEWVTAINRLLGDAERRRRMQQQARIEIIDRHSLQAQWSQWVGTWATILDARGRMETTHDANGLTTAAPSAATC